MCNKKRKLETSITNFLNMGQTRHLFVYFRSFVNTMTNKGSTKFRKTKQY